MKLVKNIINHLTFRGRCIVIYSYNKSQWDALFLNFILVKNSTCFRHLLSIIRSLKTVFTAIGICHTSYVDRLLLRSGWNSVLTSIADSPKEVEFFTKIQVRNSASCWLLLQGVPPGISLIILPLKRILQQNLKQTYLIVYEMWKKRTYSRSNFVAISSLVLELLKKCWVQ